MAQDELEAKREADRIFREKQRSKALQIKEDRIHLQDFNATQMVALILKTLREAVLVMFISLFLKPRLRKAPSGRCSEKRSGSWKR